MSVRSGHILVKAELVAQHQIFWVPVRRCRLLVLDLDPRRCQRLAPVNVHRRLVYPPVGVMPHHLPLEDLLVIALGSGIGSRLAEPLGQAVLME